MTSSEHSWLPHAVASPEQTINPSLLTMFPPGDFSDLTPQSAMIKRREDRESSTDPKSPGNQSNMRKRKNDREQSTDSSSKRSDTPTLAGGRPKKISKSTRPAGSAQSNVTVKPKGNDGGSTPDTEDTSAQQSSMADSPKANPIPAPPESPMRAFLDFLDGLPHPSATQVTAAHSTSYDPHTNSKMSRSYLSGLPMNYSDLHALDVSRQPSVAMGQAIGWPNPANPLGKGTAVYRDRDPTRQVTDHPHNSPSGKRTTRRHNPSQLGQVSNHPGDTISLMDQQKQAIMRHQMMARLYHESQAHQHWRLMAKQTMMVQRAKEAQDQNRDYFVYRNETFTLRECLLACALKTFCRSLGNRPGEGPNDATIAEIIQHQRGWRDPNGLDCQGLSAALIRYGSVPRHEIEHIIRLNRHKWEENAWSAYWGWMRTMKELYARLVADGHMDGKTGQILGRGFDGNVHEAQTFDGDGNRLKQRGINEPNLSTSTASDSKISSQDEASHHRANLRNSDGPTVKAAPEDDVFGFE